MAYQIIGEDGEVKVHKGKEVQGSDVIAEIAQKTIVDPDKRIVEVVSSSDRQDRDGDRIKQEGIDHQFATSVLYAHDYGRAYLPVGKQLENRIEKRKDYFVTIERHQFNPPGAYELSDAAWKLVDFGALATTSIGFIPKIVVRAESDDERANMGLGRWGVFFESIEKLETSWVPVPSNRDAVREAFGKSIISRTERNLLFPKDWDKITKPDHWAMGIEFEEKEVAEDADGGTGEGAEGGPSDAKAMEGRLEALEEQAKGLGIEELIGEIRALKGDVMAIKEAVEAGKSEPEKGGTGEAENLDKTELGNRRTGEAENNKTETRDKEETRDEDVIETVGEAVKAALAKADIGTIIDKRVKYHMGIVE